MDRRFGFIQDKLDIKLLILYILSRLPEPIPFETLSELTLCDDGISYFEYAECVAELLESGHISLGDGLYAITETGRASVDVIGSSLPYCIRVRAQESTAALSARLRRDALISTSHTPRMRGGYTVSLAMDDGMGPVITMNLLSGTEKEALTIEKNFRTNAETLYGKIMAILLDE